MTVQDEIVFAKTQPLGQVLPRCIRILSKVQNSIIDLPIIVEQEYLH